jgi:hypothetical protein
MLKQEPEPTRTRDLDLASYLIAVGASLTGIDDSTGSAQTFVLSGDAMPERIAEYVSGEATVNVEKFRSARRLLLDRLHRRSRLG